jgi:hypothetical protein
MDQEVTTVEDIISAEELKQYYDLAKKMEKLDRLIAEKTKVEEKEKPTKVRFSLNIDLIKEGTSVTIANQILQKIIQHFEIPLSIDEDATDFINDMVDGIKSVLKDKCDAKFRKNTNE